MDRRQIIMNFTVPPSAEDLAVIAREALETLPEELLEFCEDIALAVEDIAEDAIAAELGFDDPFELFALFRCGGEISPGVEKKTTKEDDALFLFRRPILDLWCETGEDLSITVRQIMIAELGQNFDFSEDEIEEMTQRHCQTLLMAV